LLTNPTRESPGGTLFGQAHFRSNVGSGHSGVPCLQITWKRDGCKQTNDANNNHQLYQGKAASSRARSLETAQKFQLQFGLHLGKNCIETNFSNLAHPCTDRETVSKISAFAKGSQ
jgi:hypothetical protein